MSPAFALLLLRDWNAGAALGPPVLLLADFAFGVSVVACNIIMQQQGQEWHMGYEATQLQTCLSAPHLSFA